MVWLSLSLRSRRLEVLRHVAAWSLVAETYGQERPGYPEAAPQSPLSCFRAGMNYFFGLSMISPVGIQKDFVSAVALSAPPSA
jgi:hypothetical protein